MDQNELIDSLIAKLKAGTISDEELDLLISWYNGFDDENVILQAENGDNLEQLKQRMYHQLMAQVKPKPKRSLLAKLLPYAAALLLLGLFGVWYNANERFATDRVSQLEPKAIGPGGNRATLTLPNGRVVELRTDQSGIILGQGVSYHDGSRVEDFGLGNFDLEAPNAGNQPRESSMLAISTPRGGTYQVTLPDGTQVWLNAATTLRYSPAVETVERTVELVGEAYFSVKKISRINRENGVQTHIPFKVVSNGQTVDVLGTSFNLTGYSEDDYIKTTLVSGSVRITSNNESKILKEGEQSAVGENGILIQKVDILPVIAWKNGRFHFEDMPLENVMKQVARWYNVDVEYENGIPQEKLTGKVKRDVSLRGMMDILEASQINVRLEGTKLIIK